MIRASVWQFSFWPSPFWLVHIHKGKPHVALGHNQREQALRLQAFPLQVIVQIFHALANVITGCAEGPAEMAVSVLYDQFVNKSAYQYRWPPSMYGEAESYAFIFFQMIRVAAVVSHIDQFLTEFRGEHLCSPPRIARAREIEYHLAKVLIFFEIHLFLTKNYLIGTVF